MSKWPGGEWNQEQKPNKPPNEAATTAAPPESASATKQKTSLTRRRRSENTFGIYGWIWEKFKSN